MKNQEDQKKFHEETSSSFKLANSFSSERSFPYNANIFFKNLKGIFYKCFKKVRISIGGPKRELDEDSLQGLLMLKTHLKTFDWTTNVLLEKGLLKGGWRKLIRSWLIIFQLKVQTSSKNILETFRPLMEHSPKLDSGSLKRSFVPKQLIHRWQNLMKKEYW